MCPQLRPVIALGSAPVIPSRGDERSETHPCRGILASPHRRASIIHEASCREPGWTPRDTSESFLRSLGALCPRYRPEVDPGLPQEIIRISYNPERSGYPSKSREARKKCGKHKNAGNRAIPGHDYPRVSCSCLGSGQPVNRSPLGACDGHAYRAYSTARVSRITVTLI